MGTRPVRDRQTVQREARHEADFPLAAQPDGVAVSTSRHPVLALPYAHGMRKSSDGISFTAVIAAVLIPVIAVAGSIIAGIVLVFA